MFGGRRKNSKEKSSPRKTKARENFTRKVAEYNAAVDSLINDDKIDVAEREKIRDALGDAEKWMEANTKAEAGQIDAKREETELVIDAVLAKIQSREEDAPPEGRRAPSKSSHKSSRA